MIAQHIGGGCDHRRHHLANLDQIRQVSNRCKIDPMRGQTSQRMNGNVEGEITPTQLVLLSPPVIAPSFDG